jgi:hypothetical protein
MHLGHLLAANGRAAPSGPWAVYALASLAFFADDFEAAEQLVRESLQLALARGDRRTWMYATMGVCTIELARGRHEHARSPLGQALALARERGDGIATCNLLLHHGELARLAGDEAGAEAFLLESLATARELSDDWSIAFAWFHLGRLARLRGDLPRARLWQLQALARWRQLDDALAVSRALDELATLAAVERDYVQAARLFGVADTLRMPTGGGPWPMWRAEREQALVATRAQLGGAAFAAAWQSAQQLDLEAVVPPLASAGRVRTSAET